MIQNGSRKSMSFRSDARSQGAAPADARLGDRSNTITATCATKILVTVGLALFMTLHLMNGYLGATSRSAHPIIPVSTDNAKKELPPVEIRRSAQIGAAVALKSEKIVFCPIEKVASTEWLKTFRWMDGQDDWQQPTHSNNGLDKLRRMGVDRANWILNSEEWLKFAVIREPAERLLSCFLQKCKPWNFANEYAQPDGEMQTRIMNAFRDRGQTAMFADYVEAITWRVKANPCAENFHWAPQYCHCSLDVIAPAFHIVNFSNMSEAASRVIISATSGQQRQQEVATFLYSSIRSSHESKGKRTGARHLVKKLYSKDMLAAVRSAFTKDYDLFSRYWES